MAAVEPIPPAGRRNFRLGEWLVKPNENLLVRDGERIHLRPKLMDVLVVLAEGGGEVVAAETIQSAVWGKRFLARSALAGAVCGLREALGDDPVAPRYIATVAKRGYRLMEPPYREETETPTPPAPPLRRGSSRKRMLVWSLAAVSAVAAVVAWVGGRRETATAPQPPRLVVLPFDNLGGAEDAYFAAGITDELTTRLARLGALAVISSESARVYRGQAVDLGAIGRELRVDFALQGSVRWDRQTGGARTLRVSARLVRTRNGEVLWAANHDGSLTDTLAMQADIARSIVAALSLTLQSGSPDALLAGSVASPEAYDTYLQGLYHLRSPETEESLRRAVILLERTVELDPAFAAGWADLSRAHGLVFSRGYDRSPARIAAHRAALARATALAPGSPAVRFAQLDALFAIDNDFPRLLAELERVGKNELQTSALLFLRGNALQRLGRAHEAIPVLAAAFDLSPREWSLLSVIASLRIGLGDFQQSYLDCQRLAEMAPDHAFAHFGSAFSILLWKGSRDAARGEIDKLGRFSSPGVTVWRWWFDIVGGEYEVALNRLAELPERGTVGPTGLYPRALLEGETRSLMGQRDAAVEAFERARGPLESGFDEDPRDPRAHAALSAVYGGLGRHADAVRAAGRAIELCPIGRDYAHGATYVEALARAHLRAGNVERAMDELERLTVSPLYVGTIVRLSLDPRWRTLHTFPRFQALLARARSAAATVEP